jgi:Exostosin family
LFSTTTASSSTTKQCSHSRRRSLATVLQRSIGFLLVLLLLLAYTVIFFQSIVGLGRGHENDHDDDHDAPRENSNFLSRSSSNHHNLHGPWRRRQQQQQMSKVQKDPNHMPKDIQHDNSSNDSLHSSPATPPRQQQQPPPQQEHDSDHHQQKQAARTSDPWISPAAVTSKSPPLLLNVPFYVYEVLLWLDNAVVIQEGNRTTNTTSTTTTTTTIPVAKWILHHQEVKHSDDYWFAKAALSHPQRTLDPSRAKIFVVPGLFNTLVDLVMNDQQRKCYRAKLCHDGICGLELLQHANDVLGGSPWFQRHAGQDHFLVASHYRSDWFHTRTVSPHLYNCHVIGMEDRQSNAQDRLHFSSTYVGQACPRVATTTTADGENDVNKRHDFAFVADIFTPSPMFEHRRKLCKWMMNAIHRTNTTNSNTTTTTASTSATFTMPFCGAGPQCPTLAEARYGFHVRGDTNGANRLMDTILSGTVPIFTTARQYQVLPEWINWRLLSVHINIRRASKDLFLSNIAKLVADTKKSNEKSEYAQKLQHVIRNRDLVDWTTIIPFDQYLYALSCQLWPDDEIQRRSTSPGGRISTPYSAYIVPRPGKLHQVPKQPGPLPQDRNISHLESYK